MSRRIERLCTPEVAGRRLDVALAGVAEVGSRAAAQRLIAAGHVSVDGTVRTKRHVLGGGEHIEVDLGEPPEPSRPGAGAGVPFAIAYEDEHLLVVDKPAGVVVHPAPGHPVGTLVQALEDRAQAERPPWRPGIAHRLDRGTSGLLVVAKSDPVHRALQRALRAREIRREYLALVEGRLDSASGTIEAAVGRDRTDRTLVSLRTDRPREARTHFVVEELLASSTLLRVSLDTGRTHQIRVHMQAIGHPVCGDGRYGGRSGGPLGLARQFLHAARLSFPHPQRDDDVDCSSVLPEDLRRALDVARLSSRGGGAPAPPT